MLFQSALVALCATLVAAVPSLEVKGKQFVNPKTGNAFQIVGMAYQPGGSAGYDPKTGHDPLADSKICLRDAALMQILGVNTIRVYNLSPDLNHDECASIFNAAGIYMLLDVNSPFGGESLNANLPWESYYADYLNRTFAVVEAFKNYPNTLAFFSGNEVIESVKHGAWVPPYVRAVTRDLRNYIKKNVQRPIPVGYSAADVREILEDSWNYMQCALEGDDNDMSRADLFALNSYSWCGDSSFTISGYNQLVALFEKTSVPVFFSEFGCNKPKPRVFTEIGSIYGTDMMSTFTGGVMYEYTQEANDYGLAVIDQTVQTIKLLSDFKVLQAQYTKINWSSIQGVKAAGTAAKAPACSAKLIKTSTFSTNFTLPAVPPGAQTLIDNGVPKKRVGSLVTISSWTSPYKVYDHTGAEITNLAVKPLADDTFNTPGTNTGSGSSTSSGGAAATSSNAAVRTIGGGEIGMAALILPLIVAISVLAGTRLI